MDRTIRYEDRQFIVTGASLRTPRKTFRLAHVEQTRIRRPGLAVAVAIAGTCWGLAWVFDRILYDHETWLLIGLPLLVLPVAARLGVLVLEYRNLGGEGRVLGAFSTLVEVRAAVDAVLEAREEPS